MRAVGQLQEAGGVVVEAVFHDGEMLHGRSCGIVEGGGGRGEGEVEGDVGCQTGFWYVSIYWKMFVVLLMLLCVYGDVVLTLT